jgi:hypothetical protein
MAMVWVHEVPEGRRARRDSSGVAYTREFLILMGALTDGPLNARLATGVPRLYDPYPDDLGARASDVDCQPEEGDGYLFRAVVTYTTGTPVVPSENPLDRPKELQWTFQPITEIAERAFDASGSQTIPIQNSAKMPFVPAIEVESHIPTLQITRNELAFSPAIALAYMDTLNSATWYTAPAGTVKFSGASANNVLEGTFYYWRVTYNFQFKRKGWDANIMDAGLYEWIGVNPQTQKPTYRAIKQCDINGNALIENVASPVPLQSGLVKPDTAAVTYLPFKLYKRADFSPLNLE